MTTTPVWLKPKLKNNNTTLGCFLTLGSSIVTEIAATAGFDWLLIDLEHGVSSDSLPAEIQIASLSGMPPIVRIPEISWGACKKVLDLGAVGVMAPAVSSAVSAKEFVEMCLYPPEGRRGVAGGIRAANFGIRHSEYYAEANQNVLTIAQIETKLGLENVDEIASVNNLDMLFIGPADLSSQLNIKPWSSEFMSVLEKINNAADRHFKLKGVAVSTLEQFSAVCELGFNIITIGSDASCLLENFRSRVNSFRELT